MQSLNSPLLAKGLIGRPAQLNIEHHSLQMKKGISAKANGSGVRHAKGALSLRLPYDSGVLRQTLS
jgi:hypothetical protein